jgi:hypothetical protein
MSRNIVLRTSFMGNRIYAGTLSKKNPNVMNDSKVDVTDEAIQSVFQHLMREHKKANRGTKSFGFGYEELGEIHYHPPGNETLKKMSE